MSPFSTYNCVPNVKYIILLYSKNNIERINIPFWKEKNKTMDVTGVVENFYSLS